MALDGAHDLIPSFVAMARGERVLFCDEGAGGLVQTQELPADRFVADATASNLPNSHDLMALFGGPDGVDLDVAGVAIISKLKNVP